MTLKACQLFCNQLPSHDLVSLSAMSSNKLVNALLRPPQIDVRDITVLPISCNTLNTRLLVQLQRSAFV